MGIMAWILLGLVAGAVAKMLMPGDDPGGCVVTIILGIIGAAVGGAIGSQLGWGSVNEFDLRGIGLAVLGSVIVLAVYRTLQGKK